MCLHKWNLMQSYLVYCWKTCSPEAKNKLLERKVNSLVEESCMASSRGEFQLVSECKTIKLNIVIIVVNFQQEMPMLTFMQAKLYGKYLYQ